MTASETSAPREIVTGSPSAFSSSAVVTPRGSVTETTRPSGSWARGATARGRSTSGCAAGEDKSRARSGASGGVTSRERGGAGAGAPAGGGGNGACEGYADGAAVATDGRRAIRRFQGEFCGDGLRRCCGTTLGQAPPGPPRQAPPGTPRTRRSPRGRRRRCPPRVALRHCGDVDCGGSPRAFLWHYPGRGTATAPPPGRRSRRGSSPQRHRPGPSSVRTGPSRSIAPRSIPPSPNAYVLTPNACRGPPSLNDECSSRGRRPRQSETVRRALDPPPATGDPPSKAPGSGQGTRR